MLFKFGSWKSQVFLPDFSFFCFRMLMIFSLKKTCVCVPVCLCSMACLLFKAEAHSFKENNEKATFLAVQIKSIYAEVFFFSCAVWK